MDFVKQGFVKHGLVTEKKKSTNVAPCITLLSFLKSKRGSPILSLFEIYLADKLFVCNVSHDSFLGTRCFSLRLFSARKDVHCLVYKLSAS